MEPVPLAHHGSHQFSKGLARNRAGAWHRAAKRDVEAARGRCGLRRVLVPNRAACAISKIPLVIGALGSIAAEIDYEQASYTSRARPSDGNGALNFALKWPCGIAIKSDGWAEHRHRAR